MKSKTFNLSLPEDLVEIIDRQSKLCFMSRSAYIKQAVVKYLNKNGALDTLGILEPEKTYEALRRKKLGDYLATLRPSDFKEDIY